jgi:hypothetical protein
VIVIPVVVVMVIVIVVVVVMIRHEDTAIQGNGKNAHKYGKCDSTHEGSISLTAEKYELAVLRISKPRARRAFFPTRGANGGLA